MQSTINWINNTQRFCQMCRFLCHLIFFCIIPLQTIASDLQDGELIFSNTKFESCLQNGCFHGLASYLDQINYYIVDAKNLTKLTDQEVMLSDTQWLAAVGRFNVHLIKQPGLKLRMFDSKLTFKTNELTPPPYPTVQFSTKNKVSEIAPELVKIHYAHLWWPFRILAKTVKQSIFSIQNITSVSWGWSLVLFSVLLKIALLPVGYMTVQFQRRVSQIQARLQPVLLEIKTKYDGEKAHNKLMQAYRDEGVSPFYTLKPMWGIFIQIPILIAVYNALAEMPEFLGQSFMWVDDLAYPDELLTFGMSIPFFGNSLNLMPFVMTFVTVISIIIFKNSCATGEEVSRQKRKLYLMALAFFILFYPFPAVMVLYWTLANILQTIQQQIIKI